MHGREDGENSKRSRHMWSVASRGSTTTVGIDSGCSSADSFLKDGRKITVGDCALFKPPHESPPFIGIIRSLSSDKDNNLKLGVNWLYRPAEVVLGKGAVLEAAPNEIFYSFHRDETPAASLLHPCKVAFLAKGVELPSGVSSFVCRRVYDITNKRLWWLTDKDYINDWQEEVDQLLQKSCSEMHATGQHQGTHSPKPVSGATSTSPLKHSPDSMQNSSTLATHPKGKKRDLGDQTSEPVKRERLIKDGGDSVLSRSESILKSEITKMTDKGGLVDYESVEKLVQLMQPEKSQKKIDLSCRSMLAGIIASTDRFDCLSQFVQLRGLPVLDDWLQEVHKGKVGDSSSPKDGDKSVEDFLLVLLRALDKLPVNLNALQMCNIGKSVNHLRSHKNLEIQKKARSLVDRWKKRVEEEMNINDAKSASNQPVQWPGRSRHDVSHGGNKHTGGSSDTAVRSSGQIASAKSGSLKPVHEDTNTRAVSVPSVSQKAPSSLSLTTTNCRDGQIRISSSVGGSELPQTAVKEEKSSSSSQSHTNSQCSSDHARNIVPSGKEDARSSTAGSKIVNKTTVSSRHRKLANGSQGTAHSNAQKESGSSKNPSLPSNSPLEKFPGLIVTCESNGAAPAAESNSHKIIVKIPNRGCSPRQIANIGSMEDPSCRNSRAPSPALSDKHDQADATLREKNNAHQTIDADVISAAPPDGEKYTSGNDTVNLPDPGYQSIGKDGKTNRSVDSSMSSMNALIESCVKYSETHASVPVGDNSGMVLLASVATGEISRSCAASPAVSPPRNNTAAEDNACVDNEGAAQCNDGAPSRPSGMSYENPQQNGDTSLKSSGSDEFAPVNASVSVSPAYIAGKSDGAGGEQIFGNATVVKVESHDSVSGTKPAASSSLPAQDEVKDEIRSEEGLDKAHENLPSTNSDDEKNNCDCRLNHDAPLEHEPTSLATHPGSVNKDGQVGDSSSAHEESILEHSAKQIAENTHGVETCNNVPDGGNNRTKQEKNASSSPHREDGSAFASGFEEKAECKNGILESVERQGGSLLNSRKSDGTTVQGGRKDECASSAANALSSAAVVSDTNRKLEFDLNEGFNMDDVKNGELIHLAATLRPASISLISASQSSVSSASCGLPASVTVASAAKRPFVPPEDLLRNKTELGWKGSAATSAFRPAEPRKMLETPTGSNRTPLKESITSIPVRPVLDIDLNVIDERVLQDMGGQYSAPEMDHKPDCKRGGLEFDLNKVDDAPDLGQHSAGNFQRVEVSVPPLQSSNGIANGDVSSKRNFDLNDGPAADESTVESLDYNQHAHGNIPSRPTIGLSMNNATVGSLASWYSPGTTYSAVTTPVALPDIPIIGASGPRRVLGSPVTASAFDTDFYRGSVLSSSPAMPFPTTPYQYPVFPFGTSFPLPTSSLSGGSPAYMDPSAGGRFITPAIPTQLVGTAAAVSSQYLRPCGVSLPDVSSNGVLDSSRKWGRQGLDLNSGPVGVDVERRDEALLMASRQIPAVNSQALLDEQGRTYQVAGVLKRKEPEGGWDTDRLSYKQSSWQ